ncbi:Arf-GAP with coiled-coil ANK repeat and PH domain containing protein 2 [Dissostichus eleginoides]|uniref:Arf-GAP with coiled-coil ANK repeat and PH domain containing protein 2 n=1 Tax=Dissostichus eleginoides TaxID=100907 RepID=A0AAD9ETG6_DISEL|nr:Arf-GAP with coiled-coil ANK repeat and PH domain containing protein 2 [Dissostichus eleginoides]
MSVDQTKLLLEGFLQKRKDNMKLRWVTYWFRLQNTTLFFYTQKNGSASHLRSYYYIYTVQSVREVPRVAGNRFIFEIIMTNGKRKVLKHKRGSV